jgi:hypothetical protein
MRQAPTRPQSWNPLSSPRLLRPNHRHLHPPPPAPPGIPDARRSVLREQRWPPGAASGAESSSTASTSSTPAAAPLLSSSDLEGGELSGRLLHPPPLDPAVGTYLSPRQARVWRQGDPAATSFPEDPAASLSPRRRARGHRGVQDHYCGAVPSSSRSPQVSCSASPRRRPTSTTTVTTCTHLPCGL